MNRQDGKEWVWLAENEKVRQRLGSFFSALFPLSFLGESPDDLGRVIKKENKGIRNTHV